MTRTLYMSALMLLILISLRCDLRAQHTLRNFSVGVGGGIASSYTDREHPELGYLAMGTLDYHFTPYLNAGAEIQGGRISAYSNNHDNGRKEGFNSEFATFQIRGKVHFGEFSRRPRRYRVVHNSFIDRMAKGLYLGTGGGVIVIRSMENSNVAYRNKELYLPAMAGLDLELREDSRVLLNVNYQANFVLGDKIDGLVSPGSKNDMFSSLTLGLAFKFGRISYL